MRVVRKWISRLNYGMIAVFIFAAVVQYNDPDPLRWMAIYGIAALACLLWIQSSVPHYFYLLIAAAGLIWALLLYFNMDSAAGLQEIFGAFEMKDENVEVTREIGGLLIISVWMIVLGFNTNSKTDPNP